MSLQDASWREGARGWREPFLPEQAAEWTSLPSPPVFRGDPDRVRARLEKILAEARAAATMPWDRATLRLYRTIVPQMTLWLSDDEAARWRLAFQDEVERLGAGRSSARAACRTPRARYLPPMRTSDVDIIIVPGLDGGTPDHWYSRWEQKLPTARRVEQADWHRPDLAAWADRLVAAVAAATRPVVLVAHSLGVITVAHAADRISERAAEGIAGAFLVAAPSPEALRGIEAVDPAFADVPTTPLPFPAVLVASRDDGYASWEASEALAQAWHVDLVDAGLSGHINDESGHGPWPEGLMRFAGFLKRLS